MWCVADLDEAYITNMEDVLALYEKPYDAKAPVVCLDEKPVSLHAEVRPSRPARPGHLAKRAMNTSAAGRPTCLASWNRRAGGTSRVRRAIARAAPSRGGSTPW